MKKLMDSDIFQNLVPLVEFPTYCLLHTFFIIHSGSLLIIKHIYFSHIPLSIMFSHSHHLFMDTRYIIFFVILD
jgi:hypothetical protein